MNCLRWKEAQGNHQICKLESGFNRLQTVLNLLRRGRGVFPRTGICLRLILFLFKFYLSVEMFCLNPEFWLLFTDGGTLFRQCYGWV